MPETQEKLRLPLEGTKGVDVPTWFKTTVDKVINAWCEPKSFESREMYEKLGIKKFKKYVPTTGDLVTRLVWKRLGQEDWIKKSESSLHDMEACTRLVEKIHISAFAAFAGVSAAALVSGNISGAVYFAGLNTLINVYPIMLQRYNRLRLYHTINKFETRLQPDNMQDEKRIGRLESVGGH